MPDRYTNYRDVRWVEYLLRSSVTAALAIISIAVAAYQVVVQGKVSGPFITWASIIIGVYFGVHLSANGSAVHDRRGMGEHYVPPARRSVEP